MPITETLAKQAKAAVTFNPVPPPKPKNYAKFGATRDEWRKHQSDKLLPSERFIFVDNTRSWSNYSPVEKDGTIKPDQDLRDLARRLVPYNETAWFVHGEPNKDGSRNVIAVVLDGSENASPYALVAADKPGLKVTVNATDKKVRFEGAKFIEGIHGQLVEGDALPFDNMPPVTVRTHDKGGVLAVRSTDVTRPVNVTVKDSECEIERPKEEVVGEVNVEKKGKTTPVELKPVKVAVQPAARGR